MQIEKVARIFEKTIISKIDDAFRREWLIYSHVRDEEVFVKPDNKEIGSVKAVITEEIYSELQELIDLFIEMDRTQLTPLPGLPISGYYSTINPRLVLENNTTFPESIIYENVSEIGDKTELYEIKFEYEDILHEDEYEPSVGNQVRYNVYGKVDDEWIQYQRKVSDGTIRGHEITRYYFLETIVKEKLIYEFEKVSVDKDQALVQRFIEIMKKTNLWNRPSVVGGMLTRGNDVALRAWHSISFIQNEHFHWLEEINDLDYLSEKEIDRFLEHLANDERIMSGVNLRLTRNRSIDNNPKDTLIRAILSEVNSSRDPSKIKIPMYSIFNQSIVSWVHYSKATNHRDTGGLFSFHNDRSAFHRLCVRYNLSGDFGSRDSLTSELIHTEDLRNLPEGLRTLLPMEVFDVQPKPATRAHISFATTLLSALKHAHIRSSTDNLSVGQEFTIADNELRICSWNIDRHQNNPIYGMKFVLHPVDDLETIDEDVKIGLIEIDKKTYT